jgi:maltooligosyltrehalose trehalohydrolase
LRAAEPDLVDTDLTRVQVDFDEDARWFVVRRGAITVVANFSGTERTIPGAGGDVLLATGEHTVGDAGVTLAAESAVVLRQAP